MENEFENIAFLDVHTAMENAIPDGTSAIDIVRACEFFIAHIAVISELNPIEKESYLSRILRETKGMIAMIQMMKPNDKKTQS